MPVLPGRSPVVALAAFGLAGPALAQEAPSFGPEVPAAPSTVLPAEGTLSSQGMRDRRLVFTILLGAESRPEYFGSEDNRGVLRFSPNVLAVSFGDLRVGDEEDAFDEDPNDRPLGFFAGPSFRFVTDRSADDYGELEGLEDIDATLEVGAQVGYIWPNVEAFGQLRYGLGGSESWVGEIGAYYVARPGDRFAVRIGPRLLFGSDEYSDTYFGVSSDEAAASGFEEYDPEGGLVSAGVEMIATYQLGETWWLEGRARWDQFQDDAADSPIVEQGATDQGTVSIGVRRAFVLNF